MTIDASRNLVLSDQSDQIILQYLHTDIKRLSHLGHIDDGVRYAVLNHGLFPHKTQQVIQMWLQIHVQFQDVSVLFQQLKACRVFWCIEALNQLQ